MIFIKNGYDYNMLENKSDRGKILVVDDTLANLKVLTTFLNKAGYSARGAANGSTALMTCESFPPELILLDIRMPGMDGYEVCRQLKSNKNTQEIPVIFISSLDDLQDKLQGFEVGAVDFITKPFQEREVLARVSTHIKLFRTQLELEQEKKKSDLANRAKSTFLANMSHELRTPLNAILGFSQLMQSNNDCSPSQHCNLDIINRSGQHLLNLINDVLDMSKIEAGRTQLDPTDFDLGAVIRDVTDMMQVRATDKNIQLTLDQSSCFPRFVHTDPAKLRQILINLLGNAIKFTNQGSITLRLDSKSLPSNQLILYGEVKDTGIGIEQQNIERIFLPFEQIVESISQKGTGLGLSITRQFIELMNGKISVQSEPGKGSRFLFELQVELAHEEVAIIQKSVQSRVIALQASEPEHRILLVEDLLESRLLLQQLLEKVGFTVELAVDGAQAVASFKRNPPQLIFMDNRMPVMDGTTATRTIRKLPGGDKVIIVALTASVFKDQINEVMEAGSDFFIFKPYRPEEIYGCIQKYLQVNYLYADKTIKADKKTYSEQLTSKSLALLPKDMHTTLTNAAKELDVDQVLNIADSVEKTQPILANALRETMDAMDFDTLQQALQ